MIAAPKNQGLRSSRATVRIKFRLNPMAALNRAYEYTVDLREKLQMSCAEIGLAVRTTNCLEERGVFTVDDLLHCKREDLLSISNFGPVRSGRLTSMARWRPSLVIRRSRGGGVASATTTLGFVFIGALDVAVVLSILSAAWLGSWWALLMLVVTVWPITDLWAWLAATPEEREAHVTEVRKLRAERARLTR